MIQVINKIRECDDGKHRLRTDRPKVVTMHRFGGPDLPHVHDAEGIARWYRQTRYLSGQMPYTFVIKDCGEIQQALPLNEHGPHAAKWNNAAIGVACIGDFRVRPAREEQWASAVALVALLVADIRTPAHDTVFGHTELPGGTNYRNHSCPGKMWDLGQFRRDVHDRLVLDCIRDVPLALAQAGIQIE